MFQGSEINKLVAATLAASAAATAGAGTDTATYLTAYRDMLLGLDRVDDQIAQDRAASAMKRLNKGRADGMIT